MIRISRPATPALRAVLRPLAGAAPARPAMLAAGPATATRAISRSTVSSYSTYLAASRGSPRALRGPVTPSLSRRAYSAITIDEPAPVVDFEAMKQLATAAPFPADKYVLVDVREPAEVAEGYIPHAINIPYKSAPGALGLEPEEFEDTFGFPKPDAAKELVFYCLGGVRSTAAESLAATFGYKQ